MSPANNLKKNKNIVSIMKVYYVYLITNTVNGKSYVGMTCNANGVKGRYAMHKSNSIRYVKDCKMYADMRTFGFEKFMVETLMMCSKKHAEMYERKFIQTLKCLEPNGYNKDTGGLSGYSRSKEIRERCSSSRKGPDTLPMYITRVRARSGLLSVFQVIIGNIFKHLHTHRNIILWQHIPIMTNV